MKKKKAGIAMAVIAVIAVAVMASFVLLCMRPTHTETSEYVVMYNQLVSDEDVERTTFGADIVSISEVDGKTMAIVTGDVSTRRIKWQPEVDFVTERIYYTNASIGEK